MATEKQTSATEIERQYIALPDAGNLVGRSYATIRKWAAPASGPLLPTIAHPTDKRVRLACIDDLARLHVRTSRRGWVRNTRSIPVGDGSSISVVVPERTS